MTGMDTRVLVRDDALDLGTYAVDISPIREFMVLPLAFV